MPYEPFELVPLGRTRLQVTRLGLGAASIGGLYRAVSDSEAAATLARAWELGIRYFDVAPLYGYGTAERRVGEALRERPRDRYVLSSKVGRLVRATEALAPDADIDRQRNAGRDDAFYPATAGRHVVFDYSRDGVRRSIDESLERLGLDRLDVAFIHDPDDHWAVAIDEAYPALEALRAAGVVGAIGVGMNQSAMLERFVREADLDVILLAGRYTLLDQGAAATLLPACLERGVAVAVGGVMNSGLLADPRPGARFDYGEAAPALVTRAQAIAAVCARHGIDTRAAAMQFPLAHPAVVSLIAGVRSVAHLDDYPAGLHTTIPAALWADLRAEGLLAAELPVPG